MIRNIALLVLLFFLTACAPTKPSPTGGSITKVTLLPDTEGKTGIVAIRNETSTVELKQAYSYVAVSDVKQTIKVQRAEKETVKKEIEELIEVEPSKPKQFLLYFKYDSTELTPQSRKLLPVVVQTIKEREYAEISVIGHTDTKGSAKHNLKLSMQRARVVEKLLKEVKKDLKNVLVQSFGENDLLIPTGDNVSEVKNRRVEIMIR